MNTSTFGSPAQRLAQLPFVSHGGDEHLSSLPQHVCPLAAAGCLGVEKVEMSLSRS
jgi:hypothetical protein